MRSRTLLFVALGTALVLRVAAILLEGDVSEKANIWEYGEQGLCALRHGGQLCLYYSSSGGESYPSAYMPPMLSYFWLILFQIFGDGWVARAIWLAANTAAALGCVALVFYLAQKLWPARWAAFAASMLIACYPTFVYVTAVYHQSNWAVLLLLSVTAVAVKLASGANPIAYGALGGLLCGLAALNRSEMLVIGPVLLALGAVWGRRSSTIVKAGVASALVMVVVLAPWTIRNYQEFGLFIPTAQSSGYNLWKGYNPYTNGSGNLSEDQNEPGGRELTLINESVAPGPGYESRVQEAFMEAFEKDLENASPQRLVTLTATKVALLWGFDWTDKATTGTPAYLVPWIVTNIFVLIGLVTIWRRRRCLERAPAVIYLTAVGLLTAAYAVTCVHARYRMHIEPYLFIVAGIGIHAVWLRLTTRRDARSEAVEPAVTKPETGG
ncbi:glycosyltransferase family 39 protein [Mycolicibacterium sp. S2-37]|uniref:glycosyltransferase family 39 protein n=1 Tax=Mycolicibacterium sp. S2-37 TaxID=2810297 RepID=UPI001A93D9A7|nr:glycosyltransferase family 39 protein [Mycolicibacterium sp. S2-37]MBO0681409.1 glycosyltransferase family 39 protein [Mycolicibacterium sp. S2-37]